MRKLHTLLFTALLASPAWATGERIVLVPASSPLRDNLCISMTCVTSGAREAQVLTRAKGKGLELVVTHASGAVRLTTLVPLKADGTLSSTDLLHAVTQAIAAIEGQTQPAPTQLTWRPVKSPPRALAKALKKGSRRSLPPGLVAQR